MARGTPAGTVARGTPAGTEARGTPAGTVARGDGGGQISRSESWVPDEKWQKKAAVFWSPLNLKNKSRDRNRGRIVAAFFSPRRPGGGIFVAGCISEGQSPPQKKTGRVAANVHTPIPSIKKPAFR